MGKQKFLGVCLIFFLASIIQACTTAVKAPVSGRHGNKPADATVTSSAIVEKKEVRTFHIVDKGDTLYSIAWRYGHDPKTLASWNVINSPYVIYPGQLIRLKPAKQGAKQGRSSLQPGPVINKGTPKRKKLVAKPPAENTQKSSGTYKPISKSGAVRWQWPTRGKLLKSNSPTAKKGIDISGKTGQRVVAAATGEVVYSGSGLLGYGKLIIIKHNDTYLSAYAHNQKLIVTEGDKVKAGQQISTMGSDSKGTPVLHFEIRKNGKPIDPLHQLPRS